MERGAIEISGVVRAGCEWPGRGGSGKSDDPISVHPAWLCPALQDRPRAHLARRGGGDGGARCFVGGAVRPLNPLAAWPCSKKERIRFPIAPVPSVLKSPRSRPRSKSSIPSFSRVPNTRAFAPPPFP